MSSKIRVTFLGTSDSIPSEKRNHTSILLSYESENILIDCGEGTQRQFRIAKLNPCKITRILITHFHGDHILGLPGLLKTLNLSGYNKTLYIYGPRGVKKFIQDYFSVFGFKPIYEIVVSEAKGKFYENKDFYLEAEEMEHRVDCNAYNFVEKGSLRIDKSKLKKLKIKEGIHLQKLKEGKNLVYEGKTYKAKDLTYSEDDRKISFVLDTLNNKEISSFVKNSDIFICESNFSYELIEQAKDHLHMTAKEAAENAKKGSVKKLILTHISQRYEDNFNVILNEAKKVFKNTVVAKDFDVFEI